MKRPDRLSHADSTRRCSLDRPIRNDSVRDGSVISPLVTLMRHLINRQRKTSSSKETEDKREETKKMSKQRQKRARLMKFKVKLNKQLLRKEACLGQALMTREKNQID